MESPLNIFSCFGQKPWKQKCIRFWICVRFKKQYKVIDYYYYNYWV